MLSCVCFEPVRLHLPGVALGYFVFIVPPLERGPQQILLNNILDLSQLLVQASVISSVDYCSSLPTSRPKHSLQTLKLTQKHCSPPYLQNPQTCRSPLSHMDSVKFAGFNLLVQKTGSTLKFLCCHVMDFLRKVYLDSEELYYFQFDIFWQSNTSVYG